MQININKKDVIWSYLGTIMTLSTSVVMLPMVVYYLDSDMLGLWYVFASLGAVTHLFDFGFTVTFARNIAYCWSGARSLKKSGADFTENCEPDYALMKNILSTCKLIYLIISLVAFILMLLAGTFYINYISKDVPGYIHIIAWIVYATGTCLNIYYSYYDAFLKGVGAIKDSNKNKVIARCIHLSLMAVLLILGFGILGASIAYLSYGFAYMYLGKIKFYKYQGIGEKLAMVKSKFSLRECKDLFKTIWYNAWREGFIQISAYCCDQVSVIICSLFLTLAETGVYSLAVQIATAIGTIAAVMYTTYQPALQVAFVCNDIKKMKSTMSTIVTMFTITFIIALILAILLGLPVLKYIKPEAAISISVLIGTCANQFILKFRNCYSSYFSCTNRIIYMKGFVISAVLCLLLSFLLMGTFNIGVWGLIIAQIFSQSVFNLWYWPYKAHQELQLSITETMKIGYTTIMCKLCNKK